VRDAESIIKGLYRLYSRSSLLIHLEDLNDQINQLIHKLQASAALHTLKLSQGRRYAEAGKDASLTQILDERLSSLQFYDIITQKLDHLRRTHFILTEDLKKGLTHQDTSEDASSFIIIFPELMKLHFQLLLLIQQEYTSEINGLEIHFAKATEPPPSEESVDIQLDHYHKAIEKSMREVLEAVKSYANLPERVDTDDTISVKTRKFEHVLSLYTNEQ